MSPPLPPATPGQLANADKVLAGRYDIVGEEHVLAPGFSWRRNPSRDKEWQIAHHKFYFAVDLAHAWRQRGDPRYLCAWRDLIASWLREMGTGFITASDAQVEAKRVEHWVLSLLLLQGTEWPRHVPGEFLRPFLERIAREADYISRNLRPSRNHRTFQLYAVFLAGVVFPEFARARELVEMGRDLLTENLLRDFLEDGVHVELSSHYHNITLETALAFVELARLNGVELDRRLLERLHHAAEFSLWLQWPDGDIPLINDSDSGDHRPMLLQAARLFADSQLAAGGSLGAAGSPPAEAARHFPEAGYFVLRDGWGGDAGGYARRQHVFYDCGGIGAGSHYHADLFSFCYHLNGTPLVVDPGRYTYDANPDSCGVDWRREFKSTAYHNTVTVDGRDQTRYLSKSMNPPPGIERYDRTRHPSKRGPEPELVEKDWFLGRDSAWVWGTARSHEYSPLHSRWLVHMGRDYLFVFDLVEPRDGEPHEAALHLHLAARWLGAAALAEEEGCAVLRGEGWQIRSLLEGGARATLASGWVSTTYGVKQVAPVLRVGRAGQGALVFASLLGPDAPRFRVQRFAREQSAGGQCFVVEGLRAGVRFSDRFFLDSGGGDAAAPGLLYRGPRAAWRMGDGGSIEYGFAARPNLLEIRGAPQADAEGRGHVEWWAGDVALSPP
ncbi:MAG TPA: alginate lyase family protein [Burkholderiales bacterium]|nr:alginate lyase family protein [Burkholderiales bacterium]